MKIISQFLLPRELWDDILEQLKIKNDNFRFEPTTYIWVIGLAYY